MKILYWTPRYWPTIGGTQVLALATIKGLAHRGHEILIATSQESVNQPSGDNHEGIPIRRFPFWAALSRRDPAQILTTKKAVSQMKKEFGPDIIHLDFSGYTAFFHVETADAVSAPTVLELHSDLSGIRRGGDTTAQRLFEEVAWVSAVSRAALAAAQSEFPGIMGRSSVIPGCIPDWSGGSPAAIPKDAVIVAVGRLSHEKGFDVLMEAAALLGYYPDLRVRIVGDGPERANLEKQRDRLGLGRTVTFEGSVPNADLPAQLGGAHVVVVPSRCQEAFGMVALEAATMGKPVIASNAGGLSEIVVQGRTGLLVEMESPTALAAAIGQLLDDPTAARRMGEAGKARAETEFGAARRVDAFEGLFRRLVRGGERAAKGGVDVRRA
jgi:glycogen(starch) synthase